MCCFLTVSFFYDIWTTESPKWSIYGKYGSGIRCGDQGAVSGDVDLDGAGLAAGSSGACLPGVRGSGVAEGVARPARSGVSSVCGV